MKITSIMTYKTNAKSQSEEKMTKGGILYFELLQQKKWKSYISFCVTKMTLLTFWEKGYCYITRFFFVTIKISLPKIPFLFLSF